MTLTSPDDMSMADLYDRWNRLRTRLRRRIAADPAGRWRAMPPVLEQYAAVVEAHRSGRLHLHVLMTGRFIPQRALSHLVQEAGFGKVVDIRKVRLDGSSDTMTVDQAANYLTKYLAKESARFESVAQHAAKRVRPIRTSRGWGLSMRDAEREVVRRWAAEDGRTLSEERPPGRWVLITQRADLRLAVRVSGAEIERDELAAYIAEARHPWLADLGLTPASTWRGELRAAGLEVEEVWRRGPQPRRRPAPSPRVTRPPDPAQDALRLDADLHEELFAATRWFRPWG